MSRSSILVFWQRLCPTRSSIILWGALTLIYHIALLKLVNHDQFRLADLRGIISTGAIVCFMIGISYKMSRFLSASLLIFLSILQSINLENIKANGAAVDFYYIAKFATDPQFIQGSGLSLSMPYTLASMIVISLTALFLSFKKEVNWAISYKTLISLLVSFLVIEFWWPLNSSIESWRQKHVITHSAPQIFRDSWLDNRSKKELSDFTQYPKHSIDDLFTVDVNGTPRIPLEKRRHNVLIVSLELLSGGYFKAIGGKNHHFEKFAMPKTNLWVEKSIHYSNFLSHQRQTNRGQVAMNCGFFPNLVAKNPKMNHRPVPENCLATKLKKAGYRTLYMQTANTKFMNKDEFFASTGFDQVLGGDYFKKAYSRNGWGIDDGAFFEQVNLEIEKLNKANTPWFLSLMTAGTHHPFNVPSDFSTKYPKGTLYAAIEYLDDSLASFLQSLKDQGVLKNTLVIITADESHGNQFLTNSLPSIVASQSWIPFFALTPQGFTMNVDEPFMQLETPLFVLDYLGIKDFSGLNGRSPLRYYKSSRPLFFGNVYREKVGYHFENKMIYCDYNFNICQAFQKTVPSIFDSKFKEIPIHHHQISSIRYFVMKNDWNL